MRSVNVGGSNYHEHDLPCPDCGGSLELRAEPRLRYACPKDGCRGTHGAHPDGSPMGTPGDARTRRERSEAHEMFDRIWKTGLKTRSGAYAWMRERMSLTKDDAHIGSMDAARCRALQGLIRADFPELCPLDPEEA